MNKKSTVISAQFNWIFVLIIGILIFSFFVTLSKNQKQLGEQKIEAETQMSLQNILSGQTVLEEGTSLITLNSPIKIEHNKIKEILFSQEEVEGTVFVLQTKPIKIPYFITNALYLTTPNIYYVFVYDGNNEEDKKILEYYYDEMPDKYLQGADNEAILACNKHFLEKDSEDYYALIEKINKFNNKQEVKFICNGDCSIKGVNNNNIKISYLNLNNANNNYILGYIFSYSNSLNDENEVEYYNSYDATINKINKRKEVIDEVYLKKLEILINNSQNQKCTNIYSTMQSLFQEGNEESLNIYNQQLQYSSCPLLY